jgi:hypothetical protein
VLVQGLQAGRALQFLNKKQVKKASNLLAFVVVERSILCF